MVRIKDQICAATRTPVRHKHEKQKLLAQMCAQIFLYSAKLNKRNYPPFSE